MRQLSYLSLSAPSCCLKDIIFAANTLGYLRCAGETYYKYGRSRMNSISLHDDAIATREPAPQCGARNSRLWAWLSLLSCKNIIEIDYTLQPAKCGSTASIRLIAASGRRVSLDI